MEISANLKSQQQQKGFVPICYLQKVRLPEWIDKENTFLKKICYFSKCKGSFHKANIIKRSQKKMASQRSYGTHNLITSTRLVRLFNELVSPPSCSCRGSVGRCSLIQGLKPGLNEPVEKKGKQFY